MQSFFRTTASKPKQVDLPGQTKLKCSETGKVPTIIATRHRAGAPVRW